MTYFGFALADSMFAGACTIKRRPISPEAAREAVGEGAISCCNASHAATIAAARDRYGIELEIPPVPPRVELADGDTLIVMGVRGLPRLTDRHEYTPEEIAAATFSFARYRVLAN